MKYFANITTADELKKAFRTLCQTMHPDKGGNADEFKTMLNEYQTAAQNLGAWTKEEAAHVARFRRGSSVVFFGPGMSTTFYIITSVDGERVELVRRFSRDFQSLEDVELFDTDGDSRRTIGKYDHIRPLSEKFGIGYYWDDINGTEYTDDQIKEAERIADNFDKWIKAKAEKEAEEARRAQEEADREEAEIIAQWSGILEKLPAMHKAMNWADLQKLPREQRKQQQDADRKAERKANAARLAAFKRNIKTVFNYYFPGVSVTVTNSSKCWAESSVISWTDGPTVPEVEAVPVFDYFRACGWSAPSPWEDYGHRETRRTLSKFRGLFGAFSDDKIKFERHFSEKTESEVKAIICEIIPDFKGKKYNDKVQTEDEQAEKVIKYFSFDFCEQYPSDGTEEEEKAYFERKRVHEEERGEIRRIIAPSFQRWPGECYYQSIFELFLKYYGIAERVQPKKQNKPQNTTTDTTAATDGETLAQGDGVQLIATERGAQLTGNTYPHRAEIKAHGARWFGKAQAWTIKADQVPEFVALVEGWADAEAVAHGAGLTEEERPTAEELDELARIKAEREAADMLHDAQKTTENTTTEAHEDTASEDATSENTTSEDTTADTVARAALAFAELCQMLADIAQEQKNEAERAARAQEVQTLRDNIATLSDQLATMGEQLRQMSDRLATLTAADATHEAPTDTTEAEAPQGATATADTLHDAQEITETPAAAAQTLSDEERERVRQVFERGAREAEAMTDNNEHTRAIYTAGLALLFLLDGEKMHAVNGLLNVLQSIDQNHDERGTITPDESTARDKVRDTLTIISATEYGEELAAILWGRYQVGRVMHPETEEKAA